MTPCEFEKFPPNPLQGSCVPKRSRCGAVRIRNVPNEPSARIARVKAPSLWDPACPSALAVAPCEFVTCPPTFLRKHSIGIVTTCVVFRTRSATFCGFHLYRHTPTAPKQHAVMQGKGKLVILKPTPKLPHTFSLFAG